MLHHSILAQFGGMRAAHSSALIFGLRHPTPGKLITPQRFGAFQSRAFLGLKWPFSRRSQRGLPVPIPSDGTKRAQQATTYKLRDYQEEAVHAVLDQLEAGLNRMGVSLPTGAGKTVVMGSLISRLRARDSTKQVLIICPTVPLVDQTQEQMERILPDVTIGIAQAGRKCDGGEAVIIGTWQSLAMDACLARLDASNFQLVCVDESHHSVADMHLKILRHFKCDIPKPPVRSQGISDQHARTPSTDKAMTRGVRTPIVGWSATWLRGDRRRLGDVYEDIVYQLDVGELIKKGFLSPLRVLSPDYGKIRHRFLGDKMPWERSVRSKEFDQLALDMFLKNGARRGAAIVFASNCSQVRSLTTLFQQAGLDARGITTEDNGPSRESIIDDFRDGSFQVLVNCRIMAEGMDVPRVETVMIVRAPSSITALKQMVGRGLRPSPTTHKQDCLLIDISDAFKRLGLHDQYGLDGLDAEEAVDDDMVHLTPGLEKPPMSRETRHSLGTMVEPVDLDEVGSSVNDGPFDHAMFNKSVLVDTKHSKNCYTEVDDVQYTLDVPLHGRVHIRRQNHKTGWIIYWLPQKRMRSKKQAVQYIGRAAELHHAFQSSDRHVRQLPIDYHGLSRFTEWRLQPADNSTIQELLSLYARLEPRTGRDFPPDVVIIRGRRHNVKSLTRGQAQAVITVLLWKLDHPT